MLEIYIYIDTYICIYIKKILTTKVLISFILKYKSKGEVSHSARGRFIQIHLCPHETLRLASYYIWNFEFITHHERQIGQPTLLKSTLTEPHRVVQYVQNTAVRAFHGGSGTFVSQSHSPFTCFLLEVKSYLREYILITKQPCLDYGCSPRGVGCIYMFSVFQFIYFGERKKKKEKQKERKQTYSIKYCLTSSIAFRSVCAEPTSACFLPR